MAISCSSRPSIPVYPALREIALIITVKFVRTLSHYPVAKTLVELTTTGGPILIALGLRLLTPLTT